MDRRRLSVRMRGCEDGSNKIDLRRLYPAQLYVFSVCGSDELPRTAQEGALHRPAHTHAMQQTQCEAARCRGSERAAVISPAQAHRDNCNFNCCNPPRNAYKHPPPAATTGRGVSTAATTRDAHSPSQHNLLCRAVLVRAAKGGERCCWCGADSPRFSSTSSSPKWVEWTVSLKKRKENKRIFLCFIQHTPPNLLMV